MPTTKLYCYADETGQDTLGAFFLVAVLVIDDKLHKTLRGDLEEIEQKTGKYRHKWKSTSRNKKIAYIEAIAELKQLEKGLSYMVQKETQDYIATTSSAVALAIKATNHKNSEVTVIIDALRKKNYGDVRKALKAKKIKYRKIRGMKDEQSPFLRLTDAVAGFMRDKLEGKPYTEGIKKPGCLDLASQHS